MWAKNHKIVDRKRLQLSSKSFDTKFQTTDTYTEYWGHDVTQLEGTRQLGYSFTLQEVQATASWPVALANACTTKLDFLSLHSTGCEDAHEAVF